MGGMLANTETSRSSARARAATTMSINTLESLYLYSVFLIIVNKLKCLILILRIS